MQWVTTKRVNTFTDRAYDGNPSWVVIGADRSEDEKKLIKLSSELNPVSDTVFVFPEEAEDADLFLRFFSKSEEIGFSGHGTIAAYLGAEDEGILELTEPITLIRQRTKSGIQHLELRIKNNKIERVTVSLPVPQFVSMPIDVKQLARFLAISQVDIQDSTYPVGIVSAPGNTDIIVPVDTCDTLLNLKPNFQIMKSFCDRLQLTGVVVYCLDTMEKGDTALMRHFAPSVGIDEDPVSGAASASLGCYLVHNRIMPLSEMTRIIIEMGYAMKRPGRVYIHVHSYKNQILKVTFGGQGVITFEGRTVLPES